MSEQELPEVAVWDYTRQQFIEHFPCPGEKRVRIDVHDSLENYDVFEVTRIGNMVDPVDGYTPLNDWIINLS